MLLPNTSAIVGTPAAESWVRLRNIPPPGMKISAWVGRSAPPDSTRNTSGSRFSRAMSSARPVLRALNGFDAPPRTVGSLAITRQSVPWMRPIPQTKRGADREGRAVGRHGHQLQEGRVAVEQQLDPLAGQQLAAAVVPVDVPLPAARQGPVDLGTDEGELLEHGFPVGVGQRVGTGHPGGHGRTLTGVNRG